MQETHKVGAESYLTDDGFLVVLSGGIVGEREYGGVGFIIAPVMRRHVIGFSEHTDRIASLKIKVSGGEFGNCSVYAPIARYDFAIR